MVIIYCKKLYFWWTCKQCHVNWQQTSCHAFNSLSRTTANVNLHVTHAPTRRQTSRN